MESIINTFHLDWKIMLAQLVNFLIVALVLWHFLIKPIIAKLDERNKAIKKSFEDAKKLEEKLLKAEKIKNEKIDEGKNRAKQIVDNAVKEAEDNSSQVITATEKKIERLLSEAKDRIMLEKKAMANDIKGDVADLVINAVKKIGVEATDASQQSRIIDQAIDELKKK